MGMNKRKDLIIPKYQADQIEFTLRLVNDMLDAKQRDTCLKRRLVQAQKWMKNVLDGKPETLVLR